MLSNPQPPVPAVTPSEPLASPDSLALYSKALHDYTLRLWTESRRVAEEKAQQRQRRIDEAEQKRKATLDSLTKSP